MIDEQNAEFTSDSGGIDNGVPEMTDAEIAIVSPPVEEPLVLENPVSDASGDGGSGPAGDKPAGDPAVEVATEPEKPGQTVPLATHIEDRKAYQAKIEEITAAHEAKIEALIERLAPAEAQTEQAAADPMPDVLMDPEGFERWLISRESKNIEAVEAQRAEMVEAQNLQMAIQQEAAFKVGKPYYEEAFNHIRNSRAREIQLTKPGMSDQQIIDAVNSEVQGIARSAVQSGRNAAETLYNLAETRGWSAPAADPAPAEPTPSTVDQINKAAAASQSIGSASGTTPTSLTAAAIANMGEAELAALSDSAFEKAMS